MQAYAAWRDNLEELVLERGGLVVWHAALFVVGLLFGALALRSLEVETQLELSRQLSGALEAVRAGRDPAAGALVSEALFRQVRTVALMWVLAVSLVGSVAVMALPLVRGFTSGFAVAYLTAEMGARGVLLAAAGHLPQTVLEVPGVVLAASASMGFAAEVLASWRVRRRLSGYYAALARYTRTLLSAAVLLAAAALVEGYVTPHLVRIVASGP